MSPSPHPTLVEEKMGRVDTALKQHKPMEEPHLSNLRKYGALLPIFCLAQFLDIFNLSALIAGLPSMVAELDMTVAETPWLISSFQLTFAAFLLVSGRISDVTGAPKAVFIFGNILLGVLSLGCGFAKDKITMLVLRALAGIAASLTLPSALSLLISAFPQPQEQARAIAIFGATGGVGSALGLVIGGVLSQLADWRWIFWLVTIVSVPVGVVSLVAIPKSVARPLEDSYFEKLKRLDLVGISILTAALILFIFAVTESGGPKGWATATVLAPFFISIAMIAVFFYWETVVEPHNASIPPATWWLPNFSACFAVSLTPYFWWITVFIMYTSLFQEVYHWEVIPAAARIVPIGCASLVFSFTRPLVKLISAKYAIMLGQVLVIIATILLVFAEGPDNYWPFIFPAFILGSGGAMMAFIHSNTAMFAASPPEMAGIVGAIYNSGLQVGSAIGVAAATSIQISVEKGPAGFQRYDGRRAALYFVIAIFVLQLVGIAIFFRKDVEPPKRSHHPNLDDVEHNPAHPYHGNVEEKRPSESKV